MEFMKELILWPDSNFYLKAGLCALESLCINKSVRKEYLFVDFSCLNIRCFINDKWIILLKKAKRKIILICDSVLEPLAEYWRIRERKISAVIYSDFSLEKTIGVFNAAHYISHIPSDKKINRLDKVEIKYINLSLKGLDPMCISKALYLPIKKVYQLKPMISRKLGRDITKVLFNQCPAVIK